MTIVFSGEGRHQGRGALRENAFSRSGADGATGILRLHLSCASRTTNSALDDILLSLCRLSAADAPAAGESRFLTGLSARFGMTKCGAGRAGRMNACADTNHVRGQTGPNPRISAGRAHSLAVRHREDASMQPGTAGAIGILRLHLSCASRATNSALDDSL